MSSTTMTRSLPRPGQEEEGRGKVVEQSHEEGGGRGKTRGGLGIGLHACIGSISVVYIFYRQRMRSPPLRQQLWSGCLRQRTSLKLPVVQTTNQTQDNVKTVVQLEASRMERREGEREMYHASCHKMCDCGPSGKQDSLYRTCVEQSNLFSLFLDLDQFRVPLFHLLRVGAKEEGEYTRIVLAVE